MSDERCPHCGGVMSWDGFGWGCMDRCEKSRPSAAPVAAPDNDLVGGEGPAIPRAQYEAALKGSGCIEIFDPAIDDFRVYDVTTPEGIGAVVAELTGRMFRAAVEANLSRAAVAAPGAGEADHANDR
jgi:hypothetical protein